MVIRKLISWFKGEKPKYTNKDLRDISMFGVWNSPTGMRLILEKQASGFKACKKCNATGCYGNVLCGALYRCAKCKGTGKKF